MYAVIFKAEIKRFDAEYDKTARRMRELAMNEFGCKDFVSCGEDDIEVAISYWDSLEQIESWKNHPEHVAAQKRGRERWYKSYKVQVTEILREYDS